MSSNKRTLLTGFALISLFFSGAFIIWAGSYIPGNIGYTFRFIAGLISTPFIMEATIAIVSLFIVLTLNAYRREKEGDDYMTIEVDEEDS